LSASIFSPRPSTPAGIPARGALLDLDRMGVVSESARLQPRTADPVEYGLGDASESGRSRLSADAAAVSLDMLNAQPGQPGSMRTEAVAEILVPGERNGRV
jgi:hypothetical protein